MLILLRRGSQTQGLDFRKGISMKFRPCKISHRKTTQGGGLTEDRVNRSSLTVIKIIQVDKFGKEEIIFYFSGEKTNGITKGENDMPTKSVLFLYLAVAVLVLLVLTHPIHPLFEITIYTNTKGLSISDLAGMVTLAFSVIGVLVAIVALFIGPDLFKERTQKLIEENDDIAAGRLGASLAYALGLIQWDRSSDKFELNKKFKVEEPLIENAEKALYRFQKIKDQERVKEFYHRAINNLLFYYALYEDPKYALKAVNLLRVWNTLSPEVRYSENRQLSALWVEMIYVEEVYPSISPQHQEQKIDEMISKVERMLDSKTPKLNPSELRAFIKRAEDKKAKLACRPLFPRTRSAPHRRKKQ